MYVLLISKHVIMVGGPHREEEMDAKVVRKKRRQVERQKLAESLVRSQHPSKISLTSIWNTTMIDHPSIPVDLGDDDRSPSGHHQRVTSFASSDMSDGVCMDDGGYSDEAGRGGVCSSRRSWMASAGGEQRGRETLSRKSSGLISPRKGQHPRLPPVSSRIESERDTMDAKMSVLSQKDRKRRRRQETIAKSAQLAKDASMLSVSGLSSAVTPHPQRYVVP
jgi:hypothetical protein